MKQKIEVTGIVLALRQIIKWAQLALAMALASSFIYLAFGEQDAWLGWGILNHVKRSPRELFSLNGLTGFLLQKNRTTRETCTFATPEHGRRCVLVVPGVRFYVGDEAVACMLDLCYSIAFLIVFLGEMMVPPTL